MPEEGQASEKERERSLSLSAAFKVSLRPKTPASICTYRLSLYLTACSQSYSVKSEYSPNSRLTSASLFSPPVPHTVSSAPEKCSHFSALGQHHSFLLL